MKSPRDHWVKRFGTGEEKSIIIWFHCSNTISTEFNDRGCYDNVPTDQNIHKINA